jgi:hypothetical protein
MNSFANVVQLPIGYAVTVLLDRRSGFHALLAVRVIIIA